MKVYLENLYGFNDGKRSYYRKRGSFYFDLVTDKKYASDLTADEVESIMRCAEWYKGQYCAETIGVEE